VTGIMNGPGALENGANVTAATTKLSATSVGLPSSWAFDNARHDKVQS